MSTGCNATPLLKAAPEPDQIADRLDGGGWRGLELCLTGRHVADDGALARTIEAAKTSLPDGLTVTAEAPVAWPSGAFVSVDRLDDEARACIERSAAFAAAIGSPVLTIHLYVPLDPAAFRAAAPLDEPKVEAWLRYYAQACLAQGVTPLIENVPPVLRMRTGGVFLTPVGGHWRDLVHWRDRVPELCFTLDTSHAALFANFARTYPSLFDLPSADEVAVERYVAELGPASEVAHVSDAAGLLGEGLPYGAGELDLDPLVAWLGRLVPYIVAEINEPDPARSPDMKAGYLAIERALRGPTQVLERRRPRLPADPFDWQRVTGRRDPVPSVLELEERVRGRRVVITGGAGSIGRALTTLLLGFRPTVLTMIDANEAALARDHRLRDPLTRKWIDHVLCDIRDPGRLDAEIARAAPDLLFHLAAYKHVDMAERYPEEFVATNLEASLSVLSAAEAVECETVVVASTDKAATQANLYSRTKLLMEELTAWSAERTGASRLAVRLVNVLSSAGSASELFLSQARAGVPLTVTDTGMERYWITMAHASVLVAHAALLAEDGARLATAADPVELTVGEVAERIWRATGQEGGAALDVVGVRPGETMREVLVAPGEILGGEGRQGCAQIERGASTERVAAVLRSLEGVIGTRARRAVWLAALHERAPQPAGEGRGH